MDTVRFVITDLWRDYGDPRVTVMPLYDGGPWRVAGISLVYLLFVKV